jgi:hypothetical protein
MDNGLKNKLTRFEETPRPGVWDKILEALDDEEDFAGRLYNYSQDPPLTVWSSIEKNLDEEISSGKIIPFGSRFNKSIRIVAAASIIGIIAITTTLLLNRTEADVFKVGNTATTPTRQAVTQLSKQNKAIPNPKASAPDTSIKETITIQAQFNRRLLNLIQPQELITTVAVAGKFIPGKVIKEALFNNKSVDNYMVFSDGDGMTMRMPKKLFPLVNCEHGDRSCQQRIKFLQQKISAASLSTDFGAVLEMLHQVQ